MQTLRATKIYTDANLKVIAIEAIHCNREKSDECCRLYAGIVPTAMVVSTASDYQVVNLTPKEFSLEELEREVLDLCDLMRKS